MGETRTGWFYRWEKPVRTGLYECLYGASNAPRLLRWDGTCFVDKHGRDWIVTRWRGLTKEAAEKIEQHERVHKWYANTYNKPKRISEMEPSDMQALEIPTPRISMFDELGKAPKTLVQAAPKLTATKEDWLQWAQRHTMPLPTREPIDPEVQETVGRYLFFALPYKCMQWIEWEGNDKNKAPILSREDAEKLVKHYETLPLGEEFRFMQKACSDYYNVSKFASTPGFHAMLQRIAGYWRGVNKWH